MPYHQKVLVELKNAGGQDIELYINSGGGSVFAGSEIYTALKEYKGKITSKVTGVAASAATFFVLASDVVMVSPLGQLMIHNAATSTDGDRLIHASSLEMLEGVDKSIAKVYQGKTKMSDVEVIELMQKTTWMNAEKAVQLGFADEIMFEEEVDVKNSIDPSVEIPQEVVDKLKNELLNSAMKGNTNDIFESLRAGLLPGPEDEPINFMPTQQTKERVENIMNLEQLKAQHPDLYNQVLDEGKTQGVTNERDRITQLNALAKAPGAAEIVATAIAEGKTAGETAMEIVQASAQRITEAGANRKDDAKNSGVDDVPADEAPANKSEPDYDDVANSILAELPNVKGVR